MPAGRIDEDNFFVCNDCHAALKAGNVPSMSYVRVDEGPWPLGADDGLPLPRLTALEERIIAPYRLHQHIIICRPGMCGPRTPCTPVVLPDVQPALDSFHCSAFD
jgi:hypothetical protein